MKQLVEMDKRITNEKGHTKRINNNHSKDNNSIKVDDDDNYDQVDSKNFNTTKSKDGDLNLVYSAVGPSSNLGVVTSQVNHCHSLTGIRVPSYKTFNQENNTFQCKTNELVDATSNENVTKNNDKKKLLLVKKVTKSTSTDDETLTRKKLSITRWKKLKVIFSFLKVLCIYLLYVNSSKRPSIGRIIGVNLCLLSLTFFFIFTWMAFVTFTMAMSLVLQTSFTLLF